MDDKGTGGMDTHVMDSGMDSGRRKVFLGEGFSISGRRNIEAAE